MQAHQEYHEMVKEWLMSMECIEYMQRVEWALRKEEKRAEMYLEARTK